MSEDKEKTRVLKYVWQDGDYKLVSEKEFNELVEKGEITLYDFKKEFSCCHKSICCSCEEEDINIAKEISFKIFQFIKKEYFNSLFKNEPFKQTLIKIFNNLIPLCKKILPEEIVLTKQICCAVCMSLLDKLANDKDLKLSEEDIKTLLQSLFKLNIKNRVDVRNHNEINEDIKNLKWFELAIRKTLKILDGELTQNDFDKIKYLKIAEPYNNKYSLEISLNSPPFPFIDVGGGDEWEYCCVGKENLEKSLNILPSNITKEFGCFTYSDRQIKTSKQFYNNIKLFDERGIESKEIINSALKVEVVDWLQSVNTLANELIKFKNIEVLRIKGIPFENLYFLKEFKNLKVLELADCGNIDIGTLKHLTKLEQLCVW